MNEIINEEVEIRNFPIIKRREKDEPLNIEIPICCREGHPDCPHVVNVSKFDAKKKQNIGL